MIRRYSFPNLLTWLAPVLALAVAGCQTDSVPGPQSGADYFPLEVGRYRIYAVSDTLWTNFQRTATSYQFREMITDRINDATGQPGYRIVRAKRMLPTDLWRDDSVMFVAATDNALLLTRNNRRSVELVFPVQPDRSWNMYAFSLVDTALYTMNLDNRRYQDVAQPFAASAGGKTYRYDQTLTTALVVNNNNAYGADDDYYRSTYEQVYAKGVGPVYRARRRFSYCPEQVGSCKRSNTRIYKGRTLVEVLIEQGKM
ncbi:hypothetical protein [Hymenobacter cellulosivorans]|uniref:DUF4136 domain-containing protein n=1 Tax=Hymenobacter cellulosivorans TaxID=2932249 RepID=A0ABY4F5N8_9BACT|nr:hypothetical protein [Hymenobacter cellulosivorans]UOQ51635.1 hypothetical protein MUN80_17950 [Hymenobacter cellulosivorans]